MTDFEQTVLRELGDIKAAVATTTQAHADQTRRIDELVEYNKIQDSRGWIKSVVVGALVVVGHPIVRKLGIDI